MAIIFTQTDTAAQDGGMAACSGNTVTGTPQSTQMSEGATAGTTEQTIDFGNGDTNVVGYAMQSAPGEPADTSWESGTWTVRLNITTGNTNLEINAVHICRVNSAGTNQETIGSVTGLTEAASAGVHSWSISGAAATAQETDEVYITVTFTQASGHGGQSLGVTPDQNVDTPLSLVALGAATLTGSATQTATAQAGTPISGTCTLDGTAISGAEIYVVDSTSDTVVTVVASDGSGNWSALVPSGTTYHAAASYDDGTDQYNDHSNPFLVT